MGIFRQFPYSNFHDMNMDEIIKIVKNMLEEWAQYYTTWDNWKEQVTTEWSEMQAFINNYFDNLDVQDEINNKINAMVSSGEFSEIVDPYVPPAVSAWLAAHITTPETVVIDDTLSIEGACADAKATGNAFANEYSALSTYKVGDYVIHSGLIVKCIRDITTPEVYDGSKWITVATVNEISDLYNKLISCKNNNILFESGMWNDNGIKTYYPRRIRSANYIPIEDFYKISFPSPFAAYAIIYDENKIKLGFYGYNGGQGSTDIYRGDLLASQPTGKYFILDVLKRDDLNNDISAYVDYITTNTNCITQDAHRIDNSYLCWLGTPIDANTDLQTLTDFGTYYCQNDATAVTLTNCPTDKPFRMIVEASSGNDEDYLIQKITDIDGAEYTQICKNGVWSNNYNATLPKLSYKRKRIIRNLIEKYIDNRQYFYYEFNSTRNIYADNSCYTPKSEVVEQFPAAASVDLDGFFIINCSLYVQLLLMGRDPGDFINKDDESYAPDITIYEDPTYGEYDFGYYFDFVDREKCYGVGVRDEHGDLIRLYGYSGTGEEAASYNTRYSTGNTTGLYVDGQPINQSWLLFMTASDMALELWRKGCEIQMSDLDIGDLVFTKQIYINDSFEATSFRGIDHVVMVYDFDVNGLPKFTEASWLYPSLVKRGYDFEEDVDVLRTQKILRYAVMCARNPAAFNLGGNVPTEITEL